MSPEAAVSSSSSSALVISTLPPHFGNGDLDGALAAANLDHAGIVPIYEIGEHDGQHYFSMGFVEGQSLAEKLQDGPLPPREAATTIRKVAAAVACAHGKGVIHRDLKPANVLLDLQDEPKVTDFGLAKQIESELVL